MFLFAYNLQEPSGIFTFMTFSAKLEKLKYKCYTVIATYIQNQPYHEIQEIEIYQIIKLKNQI